MKCGDWSTATVTGTFAQLGKTHAFRDHHSLPLATARYRSQQLATAARWLLALLTTDGLLGLGHTSPSQKTDAQH